MAAVMSCENALVVAVAVVVASLRLSSRCFEEFTETERIVQWPEPALSSGFSHRSARRHGKWKRRLTNFHYVAVLFLRKMRYGY